MTTAEVRSKLVESLELDLVGPRPGLGDAAEVLPQSPSRWYLTGFLVPIDAASSQKVDEEATEEVDSAETGGVDDDDTPERGSAKESHFRFVDGSQPPRSGYDKDAECQYRVGRLRAAEQSGKLGPRGPRTGRFSSICRAKTEKAIEMAVPDSRGMKLALLVRPVEAATLDVALPAGARTVSVFLVNRRKPAPDEVKDKAFAFQARLEIRSEEPLVARPDLRGLVSDDWDERVADVQFRDTGEYAVGHNVATEAAVSEGHCHSVQTSWVPTAEGRARSSGAHRRG